MCASSRFTPVAKSKLVAPPTQHTLSAFPSMPALVHVHSTDQTPSPTKHLLSTFPDTPLTYQDQRSGSC